MLIIPHGWHAIVDADITVNRPVLKSGFLKNRDTAED